MSRIALGAGPLLGAAQKTAIRNRCAWPHWIPGSASPMLDRAACLVDLGQLWPASSGCSVLACSCRIRLYLENKRGAAARRRGPALAPGLCLGARPGARRPRAISMPMISQAHPATQPGAARCRLPRRFIVPLPAAASRSPCGRRCAIGFAEPRPGTHSHGSGRLRARRTRAGLSSSAERTTVGTCDCMIARLRPCPWVSVVTARPGGLDPGGASAPRARVPAGSGTGWGAGLSWG